MVLEFEPNRYPLKQKQYIYFEKKKKNFEPLLYLIEKLKSITEQKALTANQYDSENE